MNTVELSWSAIAAEEAAFRHQLRLALLKDVAAGTGFLIFLAAIALLITAAG